MKAKKRAYVSVYNKERIVEFCQYLVEYGYEIIATEGTCKVLREAGIAALSAHELTGYPEPLGGKVRAMHPAVYTGIIANQLTPEQFKELGRAKAKVFPIELVVINLYPFKEDMEAGIPFEEAAEHIDVGGVALLDAAARNFMHTVAVCDPDDYDRVLCDLAAGVIAEDDRKYLMYKAFSYTASYDALVAQYLSYQLKISFPKTLTVTYEKTQDMLYGENPHQRAAVYREPLLKEGSIARARQLAGADLTYNNIHDANSALELVKEYDEPAVVACKHGEPCSVGTGNDLFEACDRAAEADPLRFRGGILAMNGVVDARIAARVRDMGVEVVIAVGFTPEAMGELRFNKALILLEMPDIRSKVQFTTFDMKKIYGGLLVQTYDTALMEDAVCATSRKPTEEELAALTLNYKVAKHAHSSAVVVGTQNATCGIGAGQTNRMLALRFALSLAGDKAKGAVIASDSALLNTESVEECREAGVTAVVQTGVPDTKTLKLCDKFGIAVLCSENRHFKA
ncbi:MAG TPA: bifunctional phosphoribosylaminoimidazolecarboxamide formyltransferase/IMP cyclohydrolase [Firmicutes bacterium]|nr:bifunctional phosphoribosylaminoimidazolecarboxamide formyltransferase/IMP cyclohydrolase [Bacillota bacterium]